MKRYKLQDKVKFGIACEIGEWVKYSEALEAVQAESKEFEKGYHLDCHTIKELKAETKKLRDALEWIIDLASEYERPIPDTIKVDEMALKANQALKDSE